MDFLRSLHHPETPAATQKAKISTGEEESDVTSQGLQDFGWLLLGAGPEHFSTLSWSLPKLYFPHTKNKKGTEKLQRTKALVHATNVLLGKSLCG